MTCQVHAASNWQSWDLKLGGSKTCFPSTPGDKIIAAESSSAQVRSARGSVALVCFAGMESPLPPPGALGMQDKESHLGTRLKGMRSHNLNLGSLRSAH